MKVTQIQGVTIRRRTRICKWAFLQVSSLILWFLNTFPLIMQIIKDKKNWETLKPIIDTTLDFNKRLNMQSLNKIY